MTYPRVLDASKVGSYEARCKAGGGYVWDAVLEYRVWFELDGKDHFHAFADYESAKAFSESRPGTKRPLALVLQEEYIDEPKPGVYVHVQEQRIAEWPVEFLSRPRRTPSTIPDFMASDAPPNRLDILRGLSPARGAGAE